MKSHLVSVLVVALALFNSADSLPDEIEHLPGVNFNLTFKQYSGYLDGGLGRKLFYWLVESEVEPQTAPLLLWLNGGPGCSSLGGLFTENGPFRIAFDGKTVTKDEYSWNSFANVLYLESPINVGFSYNSTQLKSEDMYNDDAVANANYNALLDFFTKHDRFKKHNFYITGESYAGVYIPTLTKLILDQQSKNLINLQGIAIGNGVHDQNILAQTRVEFAYYHGLAGIDYWDQMQSICCRTNGSSIVPICDYPRIMPNYTVTPTHNNVKCATFIGILFLKMKVNFSNLYYIYDDCNERHYKQANHECVFNDTGAYLNRPEVRKALHVAESLSSRQWASCENNILGEYEEYYDSLAQTYEQIIGKHNFTNIVFYNGDADIVCDFISTQRFLLHKMKFTLKQPSDSWKFDNEMAGLYSEFTNGVRYYTVHGAGHMVPIQKPGETISIIKSLLKTK